MKQQIVGGMKLRGLGTALLSIALLAPAAQAKKARPPEPAPGSSSGDAMQQAQMAQMRGTLSLAQVRVAKAALAEETFPGDTKQKLGTLYDQEEAATKDGIAKLQAAKGDAAKVSAAAAIIEAAGTGPRKYLAANPTVSDALTKRMTIINNELSMIATAPDSYVSALSGIGVTDPSLSKAKTIVRAAATHSGGKVDGDTTGDILSARTQVRGMLSSKQARALDASMAAGLRAGGSTTGGKGRKGT